MMCLRSCSAVDGAAFPWRGVLPELYERGGRALVNESLRKAERFGNSDVEPLLGFFAPSRKVLVVLVVLEAGELALRDGLLL